MVFKNIRFVTNDMDAMRRLYAADHQDTSWPSHLRSLGAFETWLDQWDLRGWLEDGQIEVMFASNHEQAIGYGTIVRVPAEFAPDDVTAVEGGSYLSYHARGVGLNQQLKSRLHATAAVQYQANKVVYAISLDNTRARRAMLNLPWSCCEVTSDMPNSPWYKFLRRRQWETQTNISLYVFDLIKIFDTSPLTK
ncbi:GNAT family N-acetyltransferase [Alicyclobacillus dauci]